MGPDAVPRQTSSIPTISAKPAAKGVSTKGFVLPEVQSAVDEATPPMLKALQSGGTCAAAGVTSLLHAYRFSYAHLHSQVREYLE